MSLPRRSGVSLPSLGGPLPPPGPQPPKEIRGWAEDRPHPAFRGPRPMGQVARLLCELRSHRPLSATLPPESALTRSIRLFGLPNAATRRMGTMDRIIHSSARHPRCHRRHRPGCHLHGQQQEIANAILLTHQQDAQLAHRRRPANTKRRKPITAKTQHANTKTGVKPGTAQFRSALLAANSPRANRAPPGRPRTVFTQALATLQHSARNPARKSPGS